MIRRTLFALVAVVAVACWLAPVTMAARPGASGKHNKAVCPAPGAPKAARCHAHIVTDAGGQPYNSFTTNGGYGPGQLQAAYGLGGAAATGGAGKTVVIVDAYDDPTAASDLNTYRSGEGLPALDGSACNVTGGSVTSATPTSPCFVKLNQSGGTGSYPAVNSGWAQEISLDVDMVSAICPNCNIALVEANSNSYTNLFTAEDTARAHNPAAISNSYGGGEFSGETLYASHYNYPNVTVSSGDSGYGAEFPAALNVVTAVGGTSLNVNGNSTDGYTRGSETAWSGAGSGCSGYVSQPSWQNNAVGSLCTARKGAKRRAIADVSADADPNTGVDVYDSTPDNTGAQGWLVFGGTSVAAPVVASVYALAANSGPAWPYSHTSSLFDITAGSNGSCRTAALCNARVGWDGPTGLGSPNGTGGF